MTTVLDRLLLLALVAPFLFLAACAAPGKAVVRQDGDFAMIEIQLQG